MPSDLDYYYYWMGFKMEPNKNPQKQEDEE